MPKFTIESTYRLPIYRHTTYEAATFEEACQMALDDDDWEDDVQDYESSGDTYLTGAWEGEDSAYSGPALPIPASMAGDDARLQRLLENIEGEIAGMDDDDANACAGISRIVEKFRKEGR